MCNFFAPFSIRNSQRAAQGTINHHNQIAIVHLEEETQMGRQAKVTKSKFDSNTSGQSEKVNKWKKGLPKGKKQNTDWSMRNVKQKKEKKKYNRKWTKTLNYSTHPLDV